MTTFFAFAVADSMFPGDCEAARYAISLDEAKLEIAEAASLVVACNSSHEATIKALKNITGIDLPIPAKPPVIKMQPGDRLIVFSPRGLPRLEGRHEYTQDEIDSAEFVFGLWIVRG